MKNVLLRSVAIGAVLVTGATPALAQDGDAAPGLEEIIVTAQRRTENLQDVPIAITAANAATLAQARVENLQLLTLDPQIFRYPANVIKL